MAKVIAIRHESDHHCHVTLELSGKDVALKGNVSPGSHVAVFPRNDPRDAKALLKQFKKGTTNDSE